MLKKVFTSIFICLLFIYTSAQKKYDYPECLKDSTFDIYFNDTISYPYQWLEDGTGEKFNEWIHAQEKLTQKQQNRQTNVWTLRAQISAMYNKVEEETNESYIVKDDKYKSKYVFETKYKSYKKTPDILYKKRGETNYKSLIKIKDFRHDKYDNVVVTKRYVNNDLDIAAIEMSHNGSDWREVYFFDLIEGKQLTDTLKYLRTGSKLIWHHKGVYYDRFNEPINGRELLDKATGQTLYYHKLGTSQKDDIMLLQNPDTTGTRDFRYFKHDTTKLFFYHFYKVRGKIYNALSYSTLKKDHSIFLKNFLIYESKDTMSFNIEEIIGDTVILSTTINAPNGKILKANINQKNQLAAMIPEFDVQLRSVNKLGSNKLACTYRNDGLFMVLIFNLKGELLKKIDFPEGEKVKYFYEYNDKVKYTNFCVSSFYHPDIWYQLSLEDLSFKPINTIWLPYDVEDLETRYVKYTSHDGTEIPMYITCRKDIKLDGKNPTLLYGYGGYGHTVEPYFSEPETLWLLHGGILAVPNIRGGGAKGSDWSNAGRRLNKQNTIDDFIAAAEYLIQENYTSSDKLAVLGESHGGLLVGAVITKRPELFNTAVIEAGAFDMLRFEKFTAGSMQTNLNEFGTVTDSIDYKNLKSYSPLHNIHKGTKYPNVLLITGDSDDRVPPLHSYKFLAALQEKGDPSSLYHMYIIKGAGHSGALTPKDWVDKILYKYYFLFDQLDLRL